MVNESLSFAPEMIHCGPIARCRDARLVARQSRAQAAFYLGLSARKLQSMRASGTGPAFRRHSRYIRYHIDDLDSWSGATGKA